MQKHKIIVSIIVFFFAASFLGCSGSKTTDHSKQPDISQKAATVPGSENWPIFRHDPQLSGNTNAQFPAAIKLLWSFQTQDSIKSSPVIYGSQVFIGSNDTFLYALDLNTGTKLWSFKTKKAIEAPPLYFDNMVFAPSTDGTIYALRAKDGTLVWKHTTDEPILGSANIIHLKNKPYLIVGSYDNSLYCLDTDTGNVLWNYPTDNFINGTPAVYQDQIVFGGCDSKFHIVSALRGQKILSLDIGSYVAGSAAIAGHLAVVGNYAGSLTCLDLDKRKILWTYDLEGSAIIASPALNSAVVVIGARDKQVHCFELATGKKRWTFPTRGNVDSSPLIGQNRIIAASSDGWLYCINLTNGEEVWSYQVGAALTGSPAFAQDKIVIGAEDGRVYVFGSQAQGAGR
ncbi:PQQ-binding-like beta-propeller repeat protein [bacterium]|nr:PQQ-binding-like beta-propeller repeat protein [bacterium]